MSADERHPIIAGLVALVSVTAAIGVIVAAAAVIGSHALSGHGSGNGSSAAGASMYVPMPRPTKAQSGPLVTLSATPSGSSNPSPSSTSHSSAHKPKKKKPQINLTASVVSASSMQLFRISGTYPSGEGHILRLQRMQPGTGWTTFGIPDMDVQGGQFYSSVETGYPGPNFFRVKDVDTGLTSNVVKVTID